MHQAWHIFKKDIRYLYREIAGLFALAAIFAWLGGGDALRRGDTANSLELIYVASVAYTIARLIHAEAIPGENQFWLTRPYRWPGLLAAKILFLIAFIHLPVLMAQAVILLRNGFPIGAIVPGLLWTQVLIAVAISLPAAALAAMTNGIVPFIASILVLLAAGLLAFLAGFQPVILTPHSFEWIRSSFPLISSAVVVPPLLYIQYRSRRTAFSRILGAFVAACGAIAYVWVPGTTLFAMQSRVANQPSNIEMRAKDRLAQTWFDHQTGLSISVPIQITGVAAEVRMQIEMYNIYLRRADGRIEHLGTGRTVLHREGQKPGEMFLSGTVNPGHDFVEGAGSQPVTMGVSFYLTLFGVKREKTIPFQTTPVEALDDLRCSDGELDEIVCRAPFRWPDRLISARPWWGGLTVFTWRFSYSPFPSKLQLDPIEERTAGVYWSKDKRAAREITIVSEQPLAFVRRDIEVPNVALGVR